MNKLTGFKWNIYVVKNRSDSGEPHKKGTEGLRNNPSVPFSPQVHQLDPYRYYVVILKALPHCKTVADYETLLPWNIDLPKVGEVKQAA